jgi:pimeloyl-ACP methyl ester carboxylesterase
VARDGNILSAYTHRSPLFDPATGQIVFIMHGANRNAEAYLDKWRSEVDTHNVLAIAPEFPKTLYPGSEAYQLGVGTSRTPYTGTYDASDWRAPQDYTHSEIEHLFEAVRTELGNGSCRYSIYGHSAGGQFVHRLLTFRPDARVDTAVAANAGWYTLPSDGGGSDQNFYMPYGLQGAPSDPARLEKLFAHDLVVLLGEDDTNRDSYLRTLSEADAQGLNRLERGRFYHALGQQEAISQGLPFHWILDTVPNVGHSHSGMTPAAAAHIFGP